MTMESGLELSAVDWAGIRLDEALFQEILDDLATHAGAHAPIPAWVERGGGGARPAGLARYGFEQVLEGWSGFGKNRIGSDSLFWWLDTLAEVDRLGLVDRHFRRTAGGWRCRDQHLTVSDLGVIWDLNLMVSFLEGRRVRSPRVLEVGGGYGRLAETFSRLYGGSLQYVMVDAVPASLTYAYVYLQAALPRRKIGIYYRDGGDPGDYDCYIVPSWHLSRIDVRDFDLAVNVQSMQEMSQFHVDHYLELFDRRVREDGLIYLCNRRDHRFRGQWNIPANWQCLLKCMCPRSWIREFPSEVYARRNGDHRAANRLIDGIYQGSWTYRAEKKLAGARALGLEPY